MIDSRSSGFVLKGRDPARLAPCETRRRSFAVYREFLQIENVDVGVKVDVEPHPVGPTTPQNSEVQISK